MASSVALCCSKQKLVGKEKVSKVMQGHLAPGIRLDHELKMLSYDILTIQNAFVF